MNKRPPCEFCDCPMDDGYCVSCGLAAVLALQDRLLIFLERPRGFDLVQITRAHARWRRSWLPAFIETYDVRRGGMLQFEQVEYCGATSYRLWANLGPSRTGEECPDGGWKLLFELPGRLP